MSDLPDFRKIGPYLSGDHVSESCSPRKMMQNRVDEIFWGQTFKNTSYFTLGTSEFWVLGHGYILVADRLVYFPPRKDGYIFAAKRRVLIKR